MVLHHFFDDFIGLCRRDMEEFTFSLTIRVLRDILGQKFDAVKSRSGTSQKWCGLRYVLEDGRLSIELTPARMKQIHEQLEAHLKSGILSPTDAEKLAGRLTFSLTAMFGRFGRPYLHSIYRRSEQKQGFRGKHPLNARLRNDLVWWRNIFVQMINGDLKHRRVSDLRRGEETPIVLYTDATPKRLGFTVVDGGDIVSGSAPTCITEEGNIATAEAEAILYGIVRSAERISNKDIIIFCDNENCQSNVCRGGCAGDIRQDYAIKSIWLELASLNCRPWFERVCSEDNLSDLPSRSCEVCSEPGLEHAQKVRHSSHSTILLHSKLHTRRWAAVPRCDDASAHSSSPPTHPVAPY